MANFDPALKREIWCFQRLGRQGGHAVYRRLGYNMVSYDDDPTFYIEPVNETNSVDLFGVNSTDNCKQIDAVTDFGRVMRFEYFDGRPFEGIAINADVNIDSMANSFGANPNDFDGPTRVGPPGGNNTLVLGVQ
jgi:hypothetical protein